MKLGLLALLAWDAGAVGAFEEKFEGRAINRVGAVAYLESHRVEYREGLVRRMETDYLDASGKPIAKLVTIFADSTRTPSSTFEDYRQSRSEGAKVEGDSVELWKREKSASGPPREKTRSFDLRPDSLIGQGFHHTVRLKLRELGQNEILHYRLFVPIRLDWYSFHVKKIAGSPEKPGTIRLRLESESWLIRLVAPHIETDYEIATGRLVRYEGPSNLDDENGKAQVVTITYEYSGPPPPWPVPGTY